MQTERRASRREAGAFPGGPSRGHVGARVSQVVGLSAQQRSASAVLGMEQYTGAAELVDPRGNVVAEVRARLTSTSGSFTAMGEWGGELVATEANPDPFVTLLGID